MKDAISYKVTVVAVVERVEKAGREWARETAEPNSKMFYTPEITKTVQKEIKVYDQVFDTIDLATTVAIFNGITPPGYKKISE